MDPTSATVLDARTFPRREDESEEAWARRYLASQETPAADGVEIARSTTEEGQALTEHLDDGGAPQDPDVWIVAYTPESGA